VTKGHYGGDPEVAEVGDVDAARRDRRRAQEVFAVRRAFSGGGRQGRVYELPVLYAVVVVAEERGDHGRDPVVCVDGAETIRSDFGVEEFGVGAVAGPGLAVAVHAGSAGREVLLEGDGC